jgi:hypothetical protein
VQTYAGWVDQRFYQGAAGCASNPLAPLDGQPLARLLRFSRGFGVADFGFFLGQKTQKDLAPRVIGLDGEKPPIVFHIHMGHCSVHGVSRCWSYRKSLPLANNYATGPRTVDRTMISGALTPRMAGIAKWDRIIGGRPRGAAGQVFRRHFLAPPLERRASLR